MRMPRTNKDIQERRNLLTELSDGRRSSREIQQLMSDRLGYPCNRDYVVNTALRMNLPRRKPVNQLTGQDSPSWRHGRRINCAGYALVKAPDGHPHARKNKTLLEHRLVMEDKIGRFLLREEVVDHIDGLHLHNCPSNLRLFESSAEHLMSTISGKRPRWSAAGLSNIQQARRLDSGNERIDIHRQRRASGDCRLHQCILIVLKFGIDHRFACGTHRCLERAQIDWTSRPSLERALADLSQRWEADLAR